MSEIEETFILLEEVSLPLYADRERLKTLGMVVHSFLLILEIPHR